MNFNKVNEILELDKNKSEIIMEKEINNLFDLADLEADMIVEYYHQVLQSYLISLNLHPSSYLGYRLDFYHNADSELHLYTHDKFLKLEMKFQSDIWKKTNEFFKNKKYEEVIKNLSDKNKFYIETIDLFHRTKFYETNQNYWKNTLMDKILRNLICFDLKYLINIKNQEALHLNTALGKEDCIRIYYNDKFCLDFNYQKATNKKEFIDMCLNLKRQVEYEINVKQKKLKKNKLIR